jgi:hypothetical protein
MNKLVRSLGKTVKSAPADLTFVLTQPESVGIDYGPSDRELAAIRVYYGPSGNDQGTLVWVETYSGQPGVPWSIVVNHLIAKFRTQFKQQ